MTDIQHMTGGDRPSAVRSHAVRAAVCAAGMAGSLAMTVVLAAPASAAMTRTFTSSGTFTVPAGVTSITTVLIGGGGGGAGGGGGVGGARVSCTLAVTPGEALTLTVGGGGGLGGVGLSVIFSRRLGTQPSIGQGRTGVEGNAGMDSNGLGSNSLPGTGGTGGTGAGGTGGDGGDGDGGKFSTFIPLPAANGSPETPERGRQNGRGRRPGNTLLTLSGPQLPQAGTDGKGFPGPGLPADARRRPRGDRVRPAVVGAGETAAGFRKEAVTETAALVHHDDGR